MKNKSQLGKFSLCCGGGAAPPTIRGKIMEIKTKTCGRYFFPLLSFPLLKKIAAVPCSYHRITSLCIYYQLKLTTLFLSLRALTVCVQWVSLAVPKPCESLFWGSKTIAADRSAVGSLLTREARWCNKASVASGVDADLGNYRVQDVARRSIPNGFPPREHFIAWRRGSIWEEPRLQTKSLLYMRAAIGSFLCVYCSCDFSPANQVFSRFTCRHLTDHLTFISGCFSLCRFVLWFFMCFLWLNRTSFLCLSNIFQRSFYGTNIPLIIIHIHIIRFLLSD